MNNPDLRILVNVRANAPDMVINEKYDRPLWVYDGQAVIAPYRQTIGPNEGKWTGLRCVVACAAGAHARVVNEKYGFDAWFQVDQLRIERT